MKNRTVTYTATRRIVHRETLSGATLEFRIVTTITDLHGYRIPAPLEFITEITLHRDGTVDDRYTDTYEVGHTCDLNADDDLVYTWPTGESLIVPDALWKIVGDDTGDAVWEAHEEAMKHYEAAFVTAFNGGAT